MIFKGDRKILKEQIESARDKDGLYSSKARELKQELAEAMMAYLSIRNLAKITTNKDLHGNVIIECTAQFPDKIKEKSFWTFRRTMAFMLQGAGLFCTFGAWAMGETSSPLTWIGWLLFGIGCGMNIFAEE